MLHVTDTGAHSTGWKTARGGQVSVLEPHHSQQRKHRRQELQRAFTCTQTRQQPHLGRHRIDARKRPESPQWRRRLMTKD